MPTLKLSTFNPNDRKEIRQLFFRTFSASEGESEGRILGTLVDDLITGTAAEDLYGFVATDNEQIIGCIFFSRMIFTNGLQAFLLSPVAVDTVFQGKGIGQKLINFGINRLREDGISLVVTYGDPVFYSKAGFKSISEQKIKPPYELSQPEGWLGLSLSGKEISRVVGTLSCVEAFKNSSLW